MLCHLGRDQQVGHFRFGRCALGHHLELAILDILVVADLDQKPAGHRAHGQALGLGVGQPLGQQKPQVLFGLDDVDGLLGCARRDDHFGEQLDDLGGRGFIERAVERNDAAKGRDGVAFERRVIGIHQRLALPHAARIGVLDDGDGRGLFGIELGNQLERGVGIVDIVIGQFLPWICLAVATPGTLRCHRHKSRPIDGGFRHSA